MPPSPVRRRPARAAARGRPDTFARAGYHETSMNDVADAAGVTKPVLYQHFESKRDLYQALLDDVGHRLRHGDHHRHRGRRERSPAAPSAGSAAYFRWVAENRDAFLLLFGGGSRRDQEFAEAVRRVTAEAAERDRPADRRRHRRRAPAHPRPRPRRPVRGRQPAARRARRADSTPTRWPASSAPSPGPACARSRTPRPPPATESVGVAGGARAVPGASRRRLALGRSGGRIAGDAAVRGILVQSVAARWCRARQSITIAGIWARW